MISEPPRQRIAGNPTPKILYYRWRNQFGRLKADDAKRLKALERENAALKRLLADAELEKATLKEIAQGKLLGTERRRAAVTHLIRTLA
jgi:hypothetical protein